jgi:hypothetical protein
MGNRTRQEESMSQVMVDSEGEEVEPIGQVRIVYLGPVEPHWDVQGVWGDEEAIEAFRIRVNARLVLLPPHDPQFRRNRERVNRDAEREALLLEWDLGIPEEPAAPVTATEAPSA